MEESEESSTNSDRQLEDQEQSSDSNEGSIQSAYFETEFSFGTFWNWFLPSCLDVWSSTSSDNSDIIVAYGARSHLFFADLFSETNEVSFSDANKKSSGWRIKFRDSLNVLGFEQKVHQDTFRYVKTCISVAVFDKISKNSSVGPRIFVASSDGTAGVYDLSNHETILQNVPFIQYKKNCCRMITQKKILSATWLHFRSYGSTVFYSYDTNVIVWNVDANRVSVFHNNDQECNQSSFANLQVSCLTSMLADCTLSKDQHKLAVGYMSGLICLFGFDPVNGEQKSSQIFANNGHNDDICALSFSPYSISSKGLFSGGLLCSVSRDSMLKVWSCSQESDILEYRILNMFHNHGKHSQVNTSWFTASFMPRSFVSKPNAYEIVLSDKNGELLSISIPDKLPNSKIRLNKTKKMFQIDTKNEHLEHCSVVFSIVINHQHQLAVTTSLDYKLIVWDLKRKCSSTVLHSFSNGTLAIDNCLKDKRVSVAFGNSVFVLDFNDRKEHYQIQTKRLSISNKIAKFCDVLWNRKDFEKLGQLVIGCDNGSILCYDLNSNSICFRSTKHKDSSRIYNIKWIDKFHLNEKSPESSIEPAVLSIHRSGNIMVNYLTNLPQENIHNCFVGINEEYLREHGSMAIFSLESTQFIFTGNNDGTIDVFQQVQTYLFQHKFRFRAFNSPCISLDICSNSKWLTVTALHKNHICCFDMKPLLDEGIANLSDELVVKNISPSKLSGHQDRVSTTAWSPFNKMNPSETSPLLLASASYDCTCIIWNVTLMQPIKRFYGHRSLVYSIKWCHFNPDYIFTGGEDNFFFWNWNKQPDFSNKFKPFNIKFRSLKEFYQTQLNENGDIENCNESVSSKTRNQPKTSEPKQCKATVVKALFPLSNFIENCSNKFAILEDIKWIFSYKMLNDDNKISIPETNLERIYLYTANQSHCAQFLQKELDNHLKHRNNDAYYMVWMIANADDCIKSAISKSECDFFMANIAFNICKKLWKECLNTCIQSECLNQSTKIRWFNYPVEMSALTHLYCFFDFKKAINDLLSHDSYRQAIILAVNHCSSDDFINDLFYKWHHYRISKGDYEGAIKCLVACKQIDSAVKMLEQQRTLCAETSSEKILKQYDSVIELMRENI